MYSVYVITNQINGKQYVGITSRNIEERFAEHKGRANGFSRGNRLYAAMRKHGLENFSVELVAQTESEEEVRSLETFYINQLDSYKCGYNCNLGGHGHLVLSDEIKRKIGDANRGRIISLEGRKKMSSAKIGNSLCANNFGAHTKKGKDNPRSKSYVVQFPDGHIETVTGARSFCREHGLTPSSLFGEGKAKGFACLGRFNDYPEREYAQAGGSAHLPTR